MGAAALIKNATKIIIVVVILTLIIYDIFAFVYGGRDATISDIVLHSVCAKPILAFAGGVLTGHLLWPQKIYITKEEQDGK